MRNLYITLLLALVLFYLTGCSSSKHKVFAASSTIIGLELAQSPANQSPQAKLGYNRSELAIVPTNRDDSDSAGASGEGAEGVPDVLMELKYQGLLGGDNSGIYQRLAVGENAVNQPGAWMMFLRDSKGQVTTENAEAMKAALQGIETATPSQKTAELASAYASAATTDQSKYDQAAAKLGFTDFSGFLNAEPSDQQRANLKKELKTLGITL